MRYDSAVFGGNNTFHHQFEYFINKQLFVFVLQREPTYDNGG